MPRPALPPPKKAFIVATPAGHAAIEATAPAMPNTSADSPWTP
ncbi:hypothetical protein [Streptomyces mirabilis]|nr:hypothetical protein [Streptomyces mirabilis]